MDLSAYPTVGDLTAYLTSLGLPEPSPEQLSAALYYGPATFESTVGRKMLASFVQTRTFSPPTNTNRLDLYDDLASEEPVTVVYQVQGGSPETLAADAYRPGPENSALRWNAAGAAPPFEWIEFQRRWSSPYSWGTGASLSVIGKWGYSLYIPADAWIAMLNMSVLYLTAPAALARAGFVTQWREADVSESYGGPGVFQAFSESSVLSVNAAVARYVKL